MSRPRSKRLSARGAWDLHYGPNMTPMVDVVMVILIFFMASAAVMGPEWFLRSSLPIVRPSPSVSPAEPPKEIRVEFTLTRQGAQTLVTGEGLENAPINALRFHLEKLAKANTNARLAVLVRPDPGVPYQELVGIHEACQKLGIDKIGMLDKEAPAAPAPPPQDAPPPK